MFHRRVDVAIRVNPQQVPHGGTLGVLERYLALPPGGVEQERKNCVSADVAGDVLPRVVRTHLFLVDVLLENVAQYIGVDFVIRT